MVTRTPARSSRPKLQLTPGSLRHPFVGVFLAIMLVVGVTIYFVMRDAQQRIIDHEAVKIAEVVARQALASRTVYTLEIADKLARDGFGPSTASHEMPGFVPIPAQFLKLVGRESSRSSDGLYRYRPLSKWNLEPTQGLSDDFHRWAWARLEAQDQPAPAGPVDWQPAWRFETLDGIRTLRYIRADAASNVACVTCHNQYEGRPETGVLRRVSNVPGGKQWRQHQLLGAIEVQVPVDRVEAIAAGQTRETLGLLLAISILGLSAAGWFAARDLRAKQQVALQFERQAKFDAVTNLPNRSLFDERADTALRLAARDRKLAAVMFIDLDDFKNINDSLGHAVGDQVLRETAKRLSAALRESDTVARHSGDEFSILVTGVQDAASLQQLAAKVVAALSAPLHLAGHELFVTASVGIACFPEDGEDAATLLKNADAAMYRAKEHGRNHVQFYSAAMHQRSREKLAMTTSLRQAIDRDQFELHYQPKASLATGELTGLEALVRWRHPERGLLQPDAFIGYAEESGFIETLGEWVLFTALEQAKAWQAAGLQTGRMAVNLSMRQFRHSDLAANIERALDRAGVEPRHLELEITESMVVRDPEAAGRTLQRLHERGIAIAIDDFGIGYSSLSYLKRFPISSLKVDKSFIDGIPNDANDCAITRAILALGTSLKIRTVGEGVETREQRDFLQAEGCTEMQGFLLARPMPPAEIEGFLRRFSPSSSR